MTRRPSWAPYPCRVVSVVIPSHERPLRLRWLLNALEEQTLDQPWEVVVVHDCRGDETERLLNHHPLTEEGRLRHLRLEPGTGKPSLQRNLGWRLATGEAIAFIDDDCRPDPRWLSELVRAHESSPGAIVQGATRPDPFEEDLLSVAPHARSLWVDPPGIFGQTCNILYPRRLLERLAGFDERLPSAAGEDTDLLHRALGAGATHAAAPDALVFHAVTTPTLFGALKTIPRWQHTVLVIKRHPELRRSYPLGLFWRRSHALLSLAIVGALLGVRWRPLLILTAPWISHLPPREGRATVRARLKGVARAPGRAVIDAAELITLARGSLRYRSFFL